MKISRYRRGARAASLLAAALWCGACGSVRYPTSYLLDVPSPPVQASSPQAPGRGALAVREFRCPDYLCDGRIVYRPSAEVVGFYEYHRWATDPRRMITQFIIEAVRAKAVYTHVGLQASGSQPAYVLSGQIERLEEVDHGSDVQAVCVISAVLLETRTRTVVWSGSTSSQVPVADRNVPGVVRSLSKAAHEAIERLATSLTAELPPAKVQ